MNARPNLFSVNKGSHEVKRLLTFEEMKELFACPCVKETYAQVLDRMWLYSGQTCNLWISFKPRQSTVSLTMNNSDSLSSQAASIPCTPRFQAFTAAREKRVASCSGSKGFLEGP